MIPALLVIIVAIVYSPALSAAFFDDDYQWLVTSWAFRPGQLVDFASMNHFYRPVIDVYFAALTPLFHGSPQLFHAASIALHMTNVVVIFHLAQRLWHSALGDPTSGGPSRQLYGFLAALFFAVQPSHIDAIAWVGALAEAIGALCGCLSLLWFLRWRREGGAAFRAISVAAFALALLTHESSVVFLPVLVLLDLFICRVQKDPPSAAEGGVVSMAKAFSPYVAFTVVYLAIDLWINSRNYVVSQGYYTFGPHIVVNALNYINALYVGRRDAVNYAMIAIGILVLLVRGNARVRFATCWILLALAPFLSFTWGNTSRYLYQPAIGFSLLLAEGVAWLYGRVGQHEGGRRTFMRTAGLVLVTAGIALRFALFAHSNVRDFTTRSQVYPQYLSRFREVYGAVPSHTVITLDQRLQTKMPYQFVNAAVQWEYKDPTIRLTPYESSDVR